MPSSREMKWWPLGVVAFFVLVTVLKVAIDDPKVAAGGLYVVPLVIATAYGWRWGLLVLAAALACYVVLPPELAVGGVLVRMTILTVVLLTFWRFDTLRRSAERCFQSLKLNEAVLQQLFVAKYELERGGVRNDSLDGAIERTRSIIASDIERFAPGTLRSPPRRELTDE